MPRKSKTAGARGKSKADFMTVKLCAVCANGVPENEVATCDKCKKPSHRYCAGVPLEEFESNDGSFTCLSCLRMLYKMQQEKTDLMSDCISALKVEISELKTALKDIETAVSAEYRESVNAHKPPKEGSASEGLWTTVGSRSRGRQRGRNRHQKPIRTSLHASAPSPPSAPSPAPSGRNSAAPTQTASHPNSKVRVLIEGKRKV